MWLKHLTRASSDESALLASGTQVPKLTGLAIGRENPVQRTVALVHQTAPFW